MNSIKKYFLAWDFTRYFRLGLALIMLIGYFSTKENIYLFGAVFLSLQSVLNFGCPGGSCTTNVPPKSDKTVMEFDKYEPNKINNMYSTFEISKTQCMTCNNEVLKSLGTLRGVFGAEIETIDGRITVNHTDEITKAEIESKLDELGWKVVNKQDDTPAYDPPSEWGCAL